MRWHPNTWGAGLHEFNPHHEPAGSPKGGGRFAPKPGGTGFYGEETGANRRRSKEERERAKQQKADVDASRMYPAAGSGQQKLANVNVDPETRPVVFARRPPEPTEGRLFKEEPKGRAHSKKTGASALTNVVDGADDDVAEALGVGSPRELAEEMFAEVSAEKFRAELSTEGGHSSYEEGGPEPDSVRSDYDDWYSEQLSEAEGNMHAEERGDYVRRVNDTRQQARIQGAYAEVVAEYVAAGKIKLEGEEGTDSGLADASLELLGEEGRRGDRGGIFNTEGFIDRDTDVHAAVRSMIDTMIDNVGEGETVFLPSEFDVSWDDDEITARSQYFNEHDGWDEWLNDGQGESAGHGIDSFDEWYRNNYNVDPDDWEGSGGVDSDSATLKLKFRGSSGTYIERTFSFEDGDLHVHHDYFQVDGGKQGEGLGKEVFRGSIKAYVKRGVDSVSTMANIDLGGYSWARYGFEAENPRDFARKAQGYLESQGRGMGLKESEIDAIKSLLKDPTPRTPWELSDARVFVGPARARQAAAAIKRISVNDQDTWNRLADQDAEKGIINIGKALMAQFSWDARLQLKDSDTQARLTGYLGENVFARPPRR